MTAKGVFCRCYNQLQMKTQLFCFGLLGLLLYAAPALAQGKSWAAEERYYRLEEVYRFNRSPKALKEILTTRSDGAGAEAVTDVRLKLLVSYPHTILCSVVRSPREFNLLMDDLRTEGDQEHIRVLRRMRHSKFACVRRAAVLGIQCVRELQHWDRNNKAQPPNIPDTPPRG